MLEIYIMFEYWLSEVLIFLTKFISFTSNGKYFRLLEISNLFSSRDIKDTM